MSLQHWICQQSTLPLTRSYGQTFNRCQTSAWPRPIIQQSCQCRRKQGIERLAHRLCETFVNGPQAEYSRLLYVESILNDMLTTLISGLRMKPNKGLRATAGYESLAARPNPWRYRGARWQLTIGDFDAISRVAECLEDNQSRASNNQRDR